MDLAEIKRVQQINKDRGGAMSREYIDWLIAEVERLTELNDQLSHHSLKALLQTGCTCQGCGNKYITDVLIPDELWERIKPIGKPEGAGLLCPQCIVQRLQATESDSHEWKTGFVCGYVCAAANVVRTHDLPTVALDLLKEGVGKEDISVVDESDLETLVNSDSRIAAYLHRDQPANVAESVRP